jgi:hypothetical protein
VTPPPSHVTTKRPYTCRASKHSQHSPEVR